MQVVEDEEGRLLFRGLSINRVDSEEEALMLLFLGDTNRIVAETSLNDCSTRSHCIFTLWIASREQGRLAKPPFREALGFGRSPSAAQSQAFCRAARREHKDAKGEAAFGGLGWQRTRQGSSLQTVGIPLSRDLQHQPLSPLLRTGAPERRRPFRESF